MSKIIDISQPLHNNIPVWPGDTLFTYTVEYSKEQTGSVNIGKLTMSTHTGTHIDAPFHFDNDGKKVLDLDLNVYVGTAVVVTIPKGTNISTTILKELDLKDCQRLLIKTNHHTDSSTFPTWIPHVEEEVGPFLKEQGIRLLGLDLPSVDDLNSKDLRGHHSLFENGVHILENIVLSHVEDGMYQLIALPLAILEGDGSPVRAVLQTI